MEKNDPIYVAGHNGMVGSAIVRLLNDNGFNNIVVKSHKELDLQNKNMVIDFFGLYKPKFVFLCAAKVGGIHANIQEPVDFLINNVEIQTNIIEQSYKFSVDKILILGSSCIYPRNCPQPMKEEYLLTGPLEPTNEGYALSKIMALKLGEYYFKQHGFNAISLMPPNLYGPNDSFDLKTSHVLSALVKRIIDATDEGLVSITLWGSGSARREFMHVDDMAKACLYFLENGTPGTFINVGWGNDISIRELAELIAEKVGFRGSIEWDLTKPDGMMRKCMDVSQMEKDGFEPLISLDNGIVEMIGNYINFKKKEHLT